MRQIYIRALKRKRESEEFDKCKKCKKCVKSASSEQTSCVPRVSWLIMVTFITADRDISPVCDDIYFNIYLIFSML